MKLYFYKKIFPALLFAAILFPLILFFVNSVPRLFEKDTAPDYTPLYSWRFFWADSKEQAQGTVSSWKVSSKSAPVVKPFSKDYLHLNTLLPASDEERVLSVYSSYHPTEIYLNKEKIVDVGFSGDSLFVNRKDFQIIVPKGPQTEIDLLMRVPYHFSFSAVISSSESHVIDRSVRVLSLSLGFSLVFIGGIILLLAFLLSLGSKNFSRLLYLSFLIMVCGLLVVLHHSELLGFPISSSLPEILFTFSLFIFCLASALSLIAIESFGSMARLLVLLGLPYSIALSLFKGAVFEGLVWGLFVFVPLLVLFTVSGLVKGIMQARRYSPLLLFAYLLLSLCSLYALVSLSFSLDVGPILLICVGICIFSIIVFSIFMKQTISVHIRQDERNYQEKKDILWIDHVLSVFRSVFVQTNRRTFCQETAIGLKSLLSGDLNDESFTIIAPPKSETLLLCAAMKENGQFEEFINEGIPNCDYLTIEKRFSSSKSALFFGSTYVDALLLSNNKPSAIIHIEGLKREIPDKLKFISNIVYSNILIAFDNLKLKNDMAKTQESVFIKLAEIAESKSEGTQDHLYRVAEYTHILCREMGMDEKQIELVTIAALVHDIGKLAIPERIISKQGRLTDSEYEIIKEHVAYGYNMLSQAPGDFMKAAAVIAQQHHERYDGTGYLGLKGDQIHLYARIVAVADVFDALTTNRSYKSAWSFEEASSYMLSESGSQFDPKIIDCFKRGLSSFQTISSAEPYKGA